MKLSERIARFGEADEAECRPAESRCDEWAEDAVKLEAEVRRLRAERDAFRKEADEAREQANAFSLDGMALDSEMTAYRAAVAEVRPLAEDMIRMAWVDGDGSLHPANSIVSILDRLPKDAP